MNIGIICPSEIAERRFLPALSKIERLKFAGVAVAKEEERFGNINKNGDRQRKRAENIVKEYGGEIFNGYNDIIHSDKIDAVYIPLPPALHYKWAKMALQSGKHVLVEKPSTLNLLESTDLVNIAKENGLSLHENYMFIFHKQLAAINEIIKSGRIGDARLCRVYFGFPMREKNDFRYNKLLGGGALIDAGGYTLKLANLILGNEASIAYAKLNSINGYDVDMYGSGTLINNNGDTVQIAFGMDNDYKCELEVWGSKGCLTTGRILTAPVGLIPKAYIKNGSSIEEIELPEDDSFKNSIEFFLNCINNKEICLKSYNDIITQTKLVDEFREKAQIWG